MRAVWALRSAWVILQVGGTDRPDQGGRTSLMSASVDVRYVRVVISAGLSTVRAVTILGHELQHVREIADEPGIRSAAELEKHWRQTGVEVGFLGFETLGAGVVEDQVRREVLAATLAQRRSIG